ncbi:MAG TPA: di-heme oxidoredictase family protein, partial [Polyangiaceae bacterium]|nr:di-heme oxidoredictase family protein [Polyangiaceae bacterium]
MTRFSSLLAFVVLGAATGCGGQDDEAPAQASVADPLSGGETTVYDATKLAYAQQAPLLTNEHAERFSLGHAIFSQNWVTAPATTEDMDGLGPRYNQRSCSACHSHDGRSAPFDDAGEQLGILFRLSVPGQDDHGGPLGDETYGGQLRTHALLGITADATPSVSYEEQPGTYGDGSPYSLQMPHYSISDWGYGEPPADLMVSPRIGSFLIGLGLLEAIPEEALLANVRVGDADGVVGRPNRVWDNASGSVAIGRFGWKANVPFVLDQISGAFVGDMGITSSLFPDETCTPAMTDCQAA